MRWFSKKIFKPIAYLLSCLVLCAIVYGFFSHWKGRYEILYAHLNEEDFIQVTKVLDEKNIHYLKSEDSGTIKALADQIIPLRVEFLNRGDFFSGKVSLTHDLEPIKGETYFAKQIRSRQQEEQELEQTISKMFKIDKVQVKFSLPQYESSSPEDSKMLATVYIAPKSSMVINNNIINTIVRLVSSVEEKTNQEDVIIFDQTGRKYTVVNEGSIEDGSVVSNSHEQIAEYERRGEDILKEKYPDRDIKVRAIFSKSMGKTPDLPIHIYVMLSRHRDTVTSEDVVKERNEIQQLLNESLELSHDRGDEVMVKDFNFSQGSSFEPEINSIHDIESVKQVIKYGFLASLLLGMIFFIKKSYPFNNVKASIPSNLLILRESHYSWKESSEEERFNYFTSLSTEKKAEQLIHLWKDV